MLLIWLAILAPKWKNATASDYCKANKFLEHMQFRKVEILIPNIGDLENSVIVLYSDASHGNLPQEGSQG